MRIRSTSQKLPLSGALRDLMHTRLQHALGRFAPRIAEAIIRFEDLNGPRGGLDVQCRIKLLLHPRGEVNVSAVAALPDAALSLAAERAGRCVRSRIRRRWTLRRRCRAPLGPNSAA